MLSYMILSRLNNAAKNNEPRLRSEMEAIEHHFRAYCPRVSWRAYHTTGGPGDIIHILESEDREELAAASSHVIVCNLLETVLTFSTDARGVAGVSRSHVASLLGVP